MLDPGTALAVVGLVLDAVRDVYEYYSVCKERDDDVEEARRELLWLKTFFEAIEVTLQSQDFNANQVAMICTSVEACEETMEKLKKRLDKVKRESPAETVVQRLGDKGRRLLYPFQKGTIVRLLELIARLKNQMHQVISLLNLNTTARTLEAVQEMTNLIRGSAKVDQSEIHASALRKHEPGTGEWFLGGVSYSNWKENEGTALRLVGEAGCGKTVLFSSTVRRIQDLSSLAGSNCFSAYFYCLYRKGAQHDLASILRTFIAQLCPSDSIPSSLQQLYDRHSSKFPAGLPSNEELKQALLSIVYELGRPANPVSKAQNKPEARIFLLVDALDELLDGQDRKHIISFFNELASLNIPFLHLLATSRNEHDITVGLESWSTLFIDKKKVIDDMRLFVSNGLKSNTQLSRQKATIKSEILHRLVDEGNGMFRWAALQLVEIEALNPATPRAIKQVLRSLPIDLDETYERILVKIRDGNAKQAMNALRWISFATRPLFIEELIEACAIDLDATPEFDIEERFSPQNILDLLPGLVTIDPPLKVAEEPIHGTHIITFAHLSVQEYLVGQRITSSHACQFALEVRYSNQFIAACSLAYLFCCNILQLRTENYPLRSYAWDYWAWHATCAPGSHIEEQIQAAEDLFRLVSQHHSPDGQAALKRLVADLSSLVPWQALTLRKERHFENALRFPFFYPEFAIRDWLNTSSSQYKFEPLQTDRNEIRLVELFPSPKRYTELRCRIFKQSLDSNPIYDGVSYHWGGPQANEHVRVNGVLLEVPKTLVSDLRNLRAKTGDQGRVVFVDALCFNRADSDERHPRVGLMPQIFTQAQQVAIGLDEKREDDASAIEIVRRLASKSLTRENVTELLDPEERYDEWARHAGRAVLQLFQRPWWRRVWPVQELVLPRKATLYYGDEAITFDNFQRFFELGDAIRDLIGSEYYSKLVSNEAWIGASRISTIRTQYLSGGRHPTLPELLWATQYHQARDRVTKVYALIGLFCPEEQKSQLLTDVDNLSEEEKFCRVAKHVLRKHRNLDLLSYASCHGWSKREKGTVIPSWVPDFSVEGQDMEPLMRGKFGPAGFNDLYDASTGIEPMVYQLSENSLELTFPGFTVDHIKTVLDAFEGVDIHAHLFALYKRIQEIGVNIEGPENSKVYEVFWRTIHADQWQARRLEDADEEIVALRGTQNDEQREVHLTDNYDHNFYLGRRLLISSQGYLCLGPLNSEINDVIVIPVNNKVPYTLRKSGQAYTFIGECYVHGMMDGEIFEVSKIDAKDHVKEFCLI